ncbi:MAG: type I methionyl aminopeptidase [Bacilli bacterium]|jgi:methionyl aminopeptidase|nr:type I methionyl aminopeptidase [Bacilli bacterium]
MIIVKSPREIVLMREAGQVVAKVFERLETIIRPGISTQVIADEAEKIIRSHHASPTFLGYNGFKGAICVSVNDTLVHGIPNKHHILKEGDIVSCDVGATLKGYVGDACRTYPVGKISKEAARLLRITEESFFKAVALIKPGIHLGDISYAIQTHNEDNGYSLPRDYTGHGIGQSLHEDPYIPNIGVPNTGPVLKEGMCLAIEPMVSSGDPEVVVMNDGWTVKMKDGSLSSHYENTVVVTSTGYEILTMLKQGGNENG